MDVATAQQLAAAIQALAAAAAALPPPPAPPAPAAPAADPLTSPYEGGPLDLASQHGSSLFHDGGSHVQVHREGQRPSTLPGRPQDKSQDMPLGPSNSWYPHGGGGQHRVQLTRRLQQDH